MYLETNLNKKDIYDEKNLKEKYIKNFSKFKFDYGIDWKKSTLKSKDLKIYKKHIIHDNNKRLPFENINLIYLFIKHLLGKKFDFHIKEISRILSKNVKYY